MTSLLSQQLSAALGGPFLPELTQGAEGGSVSEREGGEAGVMTCSICLQQTDLEQIASVKDCDHTYCVKCILRWAANREKPTCPQCKAPFDTVSTYLQLDGTLCDFPCEDSVVLLLRARWFTDHMQVVDKGGKWRLSAEDSAAGFGDYDAYYREYDDDEEVEDYYFSAAAGRARIVLGNRRHGESGFMASGRRQARPAAQDARRRAAPALPRPRPLLPGQPRPHPPAQPRPFPLQSGTKTGAAPSRAAARVAAARGEPRSTRRPPSPLARLPPRELPLPPAAPVPPALLLAMLQ